MIEKRDPLEMFRGAKQAKIVTESEEKSKHAESDLQTKICRWLKNEYPGILFYSDFSAGLKLDVFKANLRHLQSPDDKMVDLIILAKRGLYGALCIEIKTDKSKVFLQDRTTLAKNDHILAQYQTIKKLRVEGYAACFGCGEVEIKQIITDYMNFNYQQPVYFERDFEQSNLFDL